MLRKERDFTQSKHKLTQNACMRQSSCPIEKFDFWISGCLHAHNIQDSIVVHGIIMVHVAVAGQNEIQVKMILT